MVDRRTFLQGAAIAAAGVGSTMVSPVSMAGPNYKKNNGYFRTNAGMTGKDFLENIIYDSQTAGGSTSNDLLARLTWGGRNIIYDEKDAHIEQGSEGTGGPIPRVQFDGRGRGRARGRYNKNIEKGFWGVEIIGLERGCGADLVVKREMKFGVPPSQMHLTAEAVNGPAVRGFPICDPEFGVAYAIEPGNPVTVSRNDCLSTLIRSRNNDHFLQFEFRSPHDGDPLIWSQNPRFFVNNINDANAGSSNRILVPNAAMVGLDGLIHSSRTMTDEDAELFRKVFMSYGDEKRYFNIRPRQADASAIPGGSRLFDYEILSIYPEGEKLSESKQLFGFGKPRLSQVGTIRIDDDSVTVRADNQALENHRDRLKLLYGDPYLFTVEPYRTAELIVGGLDPNTFERNYATETKITANDPVKTISLEKLHRIIDGSLSDTIPYTSK